jgi:hypothetical protein
MIENLNFYILIAAVLSFALIYFPASWELRKPCDNGPRIIESTPQIKQNKAVCNTEKNFSSNQALDGCITILDER